MKIFNLNDPLFLPHCGVSLELELLPGKVLVITGENGIGKSTLLKRLAQQFANAERAVTEQAATDYFFDRKLKVIKSFFLNGGLPHFDQELFLTLWDEFGLNDKENRLLSQLSGGEAQSLKLVLSLSKKTDLFFLDEPSQALDQNRRSILLKHLQKFQHAGKYLLIVEHNRDGFPDDWLIQPLILEDGVLIKAVT